MRLSTVLAGAFFSVSMVAAGAGCGSSTPSSSSEPTTQDRGVESGDPSTTVPEGQGSEVNKYGKAYPTNNLGYQARAGTRPGNIMRNYKFLGYVDGDPAKGKTVISLADLYDPEMREVKLISFSAGALWCPPCNEEAKTLVPLMPSLKTKKIAVVQAIIEGGARGTASTLTDLDDWQQRHKINFTIFLDPAQQNLGQFFNAAAVPWNAMLDARSMEILTSAVGFDPAQLPKDMDKWSAWIDANPAQEVQ